MKLSVFNMLQKYKKNQRNVIPFVCVLKDSEYMCDVQREEK